MHCFQKQQSVICYFFMFSDVDNFGVSGTNLMIIIRNIQKSESLLFAWLVSYGVVLFILLPLKVCICGLFDLVVFYICMNLCLSNTVHFKCNSLCLIISVGTDRDYQNLDFLPNCICASQTLEDIKSYLLVTGLFVLTGKTLINAVSAIWMRLKPNFYTIKHG